MKFNLDDMDGIKGSVDAKEKRVRDVIDKETGKNVYMDISGHEKELNYRVYDLGEVITGFKRHVVSLTELFPGKVNEEFKMTTGHAHPKGEEEVYIFLGKGH